MVVSNDALNSTGGRIAVTPWPLVPPPMLVDKTNTTIIVKVVLSDTQLYEPVTNVSVKVMNVSHVHVGDIMISLPCSDMSQ